jgi:photosystem II stability/assembly factor-like uncharacterized protein
VKDPEELVEDLGDIVLQRPPSKALQREIEFLDQRGLDGGLAEPLLDLSARLDADGAGTVDAPAGRPTRSRPGGVSESLSPYLAGTRDKRLLLAAAPPDASAVWRPLGPAGIPRGQTYGSGTTTLSGRVTAIAVDPRDSAHILVGAAGGGVWQSRDTGQTWTPQTDTMPTLSIGALAFDPSDSSVVYAGTGEGNSQYRVLGQGLLRSRDGGTTWQVIGPRGFSGIGFYRLVVDPADRRRLVAATTGGAVASDDGGATWRVIYPRVTWDVSLAYPGQERELLLATADGVIAFRGTKPPVWVELPMLFATGTPLDPAKDRLAMAHVPDDPGQVFAFAGTRGRAFLWHRPAHDEPFASVTLASVPVLPYLDDLLDVKQARYDWYVAVPPGRTDVVYLGAIELVKGERVDDEWHWSDISSRRGAGDSIHPDQHVMAFDAHDPNVIYAGNDGGVFRSPDAGHSWESRNAGLAISEVEYLAMRPDDPDWLLAGLQDNGTVRRQSDGTWEQVALGDGGDCAANAAHPDVCYHTHYYISLYRSDSRGDRDSWTRVSPPNSARFKRLFYPPLEVNGDVVVIAGEVVCVSSNGGRTWVDVPLPPVDGVSSVASAIDIPATDEVFVGTILGDVFRIDRSGWGGGPTALTRPLPGRISDLLVDRASASPRYWVTYSTSPGAVLRSDDGGATWEDATNNLPSTPVNAIATDPANRDRVWVACDLGVYESRDAGQTWSVFGVGLPNALAVDLLFHESTRRLRAATRSRGVWEVQVPAT